MLIRAKLSCRCRSSCIACMSDLFDKELSTQKWSHTKIKMFWCSTKWPKRVNYGEIPFCNMTAALPAELYFMSTLQFKYEIMLGYHTIAFYLKFLSGLAHKLFEEKTLLCTH